MISSLTRRMASAKRRAWSVGLRRIKKVRRCAVFTPTPGSFENSSIRATTGGAMSLIKLEQSWNFHTTRGAADYFLLCISDLGKGIFGSSQEHHLKFGDVFCIKRLRVNLDSSDFKLTAHSDGYCTTAGGAGELAPLQFFLHFQNLLLHPLDIAHIHGNNNSLLGLNTHNSRCKRLDHFMHDRVTTSLLLDGFLRRDYTSILAHNVRSGKRWRLNCISIIRKTPILHEPIRYLCLSLTGRRRR